jgi:hypothetical protein
MKYTIYDRPHVYNNYGPIFTDQPQLRNFYGLDNLPDSNTTSTKSQKTDPFFSNITVNFSPNIVREGEWEIIKYIKFPMDPKTGQQYILMVKSRVELATEKSHRKA